MSTIEKVMDHASTAGRAGVVERFGATAAEEAKAVPCHHLDLARLRELGYLTPEEADGALAEQYRIIKRPLLMNAFGRGAVPVEGGNLIMVTSSVPGEGKTFTAVNLAMSMAMELDHTVLLVDADVVKPSLTELLGLKGRPGLTDALAAGDIGLGEVIVRTNVAKLRVIPAGRGHANSTELLASQAMRDLMQELAERYPDRVILFDSPPLLVSSQASVLTYLVGQIVVVVEAGRTPQPVVKEALALVDSSKAVGLVLNKSHERVAGDYQYYAYGEA